MQIKVKDTRMHKVIQHYSGNGKGLKEMQPIEVPVAEAKLVLVECTPIEAKFGLTRPEFGSRLLHRY